MRRMVYRLRPQFGRGDALWPARGGVALLASGL